MSWESRGSKTYYYAKKRVGGQVISEYVGHGWIADLAAAIDARDRHDRNLARRDFATLIHAHRRVDGLLDSYRRQVGAVVASALQQAGYHQYKRGEWRLKQGETMTNPVERVTVPTGVGLLAQSVLSGILSCAGVGTTPIVKEAVLLEVAAMRARLGWADAPQHERLLIEAIALSWLRLQLVEQLYSQNSTADNYVVATVEHFERRLSQCHKRYVEATVALAKVRRLGINVQINVANQQVVTHGV